MEYDVGTMFGEDAVEVVVVLAGGCEVVFKGVVAGFGEDVVPDKFGVEVVEEESAEEAVLRIGDEVQDLPGRAGEDCGQSQVLDVNIFPVFAADVGDGFVVECFAEAVGVVAVVGAEGVCEGVAFCLEHKSLAAIVIEELIYSCGLGVGRDEEHTHRGLFWLFHIDFLLAGGIVFREPVLVVHHFGFVEVAQVFVDGFDKVAAEVEATFP